MISGSRRVRSVPRDPAAQAGATLTELLATLAILGVVMAALVPVLWISGQSWNRVDRHTEMLQSARRAADKMVRDIRAAQGFLTINPSLSQIRLVTAVGDGTGGTLDVEYRLNDATGNLEYRQRTATDFNYRRRIVITASRDIPAGYSVFVTFDHRTLVESGKSLASGNDVRIRYWNGAAWVELDRVLDPQSAWNTAGTPGIAGTRLWFKLQSPIPSGGADANYFLHYGDLAAGAPPANADNVFLDYEDGTMTVGWLPRNLGGCSGTYGSSATDGFIFRATNDECYREYSKPLAHSDVEVFWEFQSNGPAGLSTNRHRPGMSARRGATGAGYRVIPGDKGPGSGQGNINQRLSIYHAASWTDPTGTMIDQTGGGFGVTPDVRYYGRFYLVGSALKAKQWVAGTAEPAAWSLETTDTRVSSGAHYGQVDGLGASPAEPQDHRHRHLIVRLRVPDPEPDTRLEAEEIPASLEPFRPLAGPFESVVFRCFDAAGNSVTDCSPLPEVRSVEVSLTPTDPTGEVAPFVVTVRAYRQAP